MTLPIFELWQLKTLVVAGLAAWLSLAVFNNIVDFGTNRFLLSNVTSMRELKADPNLGKGIIGRAVDDNRYPALLLRFIIVVQIAIAFLLWRGAWHLAFASDAAFAVGAANFGLAAFAALWFWFLIGGLYHGYWIKLPQVHQVHLALVIISIGSIVLVNTP
jgi:predicted small integral membrane protein